MIVELKNHPELMRVIRAADSTYRKHKAIVNAYPSIELSGTYWDGGSRSTYTAVNLTTFKSSAAAQYAPAQVGGPRETPRCDIPEGVAIVKTGVFCGRTAAATVFLNPANAARLLPNQPTLQSVMEA